MGLRMSAMALSQGVIVEAPGPLEVAGVFHGYAHSRVERIVHSAIREACRLAGGVDREVDLVRRIEERAVRLKAVVHHGGRSGIGGGSGGRYCDGRIESHPELMGEIEAEWTQRAGDGSVVSCRDVESRRLAGETVRQ